MHVAINPYYIYGVVNNLLEVDVCTTHQLHRQLLVEVSRVENHLLNIACHAGDLECLLALLCSTRYNQLSIYMYCRCCDT